MWVLPGIYRANAVLLGWERLVLGHIMRRVIAFGAPNLRVVPAVCSCANSRVEIEAHVGARSLSYFVLGVFYYFLISLSLVLVSEGSRSGMGRSDVVTSWP